MAFPFLRTDISAMISPFETGEKQIWKNTAPVGLRAEIIAVGTEVLMGDVINSNAAWLSQKLAEIGIDVYYHCVVGDNPGRIREIFQTALSRSNLLLVTGGLGPTDDDLTVDTLAGLLQTPLVLRPGF